MAPAFLRNLKHSLQKINIEKEYLGTDNSESQINFFTPLRNEIIRFNNSETFISDNNIVYDLSKINGKVLFYF